MSTRVKVGRPASENRYFSPSLEPENVHDVVRKGGAVHLQYGAMWKLCPVQVGEEVVPVRSCFDPQRMSRARGPRLSLRMERGWEKRAGTVKSGVWMLREAIKGDTLLNALSEILTWSRKTSYLPSWLVSPAHSCTCSYSHGNGPATRPQTGDKGWLFVESLWKSIAPLMRPRCNEGEGTSAVNGNLY